MRGDLVYEKLGEIDPSLVAEALPDAQPVMELYTLGGSQPVKPPRGRGWRKAPVICACLILTALLLVGGGIALSRSVEFPSETDTAEAQTDPNFNPIPPVYEGIVSVGSYGELSGADALTDMGNRIKAMFSTAAPMENVCECERDLPIQIGDASLTYNRDHGCFRDGETGKVYLLTDADKAMMDQILQELESIPPMLTFQYEYGNRHHGDALVCSIQWSENSGYSQRFQIEEVYLRSKESGNEYRTPCFIEVVDREFTYYASIPDDAPYGDYELVAHLYSPYTGLNWEMDVPSGAPAVTVVPFETEPDYVFYYECEKRVFTQGEYIYITAGMTNRGEDIYRWSTELSILPSVTLRTVRDGETVEFPMVTCLEYDWAGDMYLMANGDCFDSRFMTVTPSALPVGVYDLVLSFEGHEAVFEKAIAVEAPDANHSFEVTCSSPSGPTVPADGKGYINLQITYEGDTLYRYGTDDCLRPDSVLLYRQGDDEEILYAPLIFQTRTYKEQTMQSLSSGKNLRFPYEWDWEKESVEPGTYALRVIYLDSDGNVIWDVTLEDVLTVTAP